jgi:hypothetical protein
MTPMPRAARVFSGEDHMASIKLTYKGREIEAESVPVDRAQEEWSQYFLADGTVVRLKPVVLRVLRIPGEYDEEGNEALLVRSQNLMVVDSPDEKKRK